MFKGKNKKKKAWHDNYTWSDRADIENISANRTSDERLNNKKGYTTIISYQIWKNLIKVINMLKKPKNEE